MEELRLQVDKSGVRVDKLLSEIMSDMSRSHIQKLIEQGQVTISGKTIKANHKTSIGEEIQVLIPDLTEPDILAEDIPLDIIFEDTQLLVINKPKGMVVHPAPGHYSGTLVNAIMFHCKNELSGINGVSRPGIVHRIDMDTTGSLLVCKTDSAHQFLAAQLKEHNITRKYHAIVHGNIKEDFGTVDAPIGRHKIDRKKMAVYAPNSRPAITHYKVLERFHGFTYIECSLETGRTHQIRVHMSSLRHPILGDNLYGASKKIPFHLQGQTLHAKTLGFDHPSSGQYVEFDAPLPPYFSMILERLRKQ